MSEDVVGQKKTDTALANIDEELPTICCLTFEEEKKKCDKKYDHTLCIMHAL